MGKMGIKHHLNNICEESGRRGAVLGVSAVSFGETGLYAELVRRAPKGFGGDRDAGQYIGSAFVEVIPAAPIWFSGAEPSPNWPGVYAWPSSLGDPSWRESGGS